MGCKTEFVELPAGMSRINVKLQSVEGTEINSAGPEIDPASLDKLLQRLDQLDREDILVLAGSIPRSVPDTIYRDIMVRLEGKGIRIVVDATGDLLCKVLQHKPFLIKPNNYEKAKTRKYRTDIGRMENMAYDAEKDCYICHNGKEILWSHDRKAKTETGYTRITSVYRCEGCLGCPYKTECIRGNNCRTPMEERMKTLYVSKTMKQKRQEDLARIQSDYGVQLRMNRSIQAEGSFADVKADMAFRRYTYRSLDNVTAQSVILAIAHNINKYHNKIQSGKTGQHLFEVIKSA
jgi:hypothetical protein